MEQQTTHENTNQSPTSTTTNAVARGQFKIPGDVVNKATADLEDDQRSLIRWFHAYCVANDLPMAEAAKAIRYDESTVWRIFNGKYQGSVDNVCREIRDLKHITEERGVKNLDFVKTTTAVKIWKVCEAALNFQRIGFIFGRSQTGKTAAILKYVADHNHGSTVYVRMPVGGVFGNFLVALARALRISAFAREKDLIRRCVEAFDNRMLLIIDEAHQALCGRTGMSGVRTLEYIREIHDTARCGLVFCATPVFGVEMETGRYAGILEQCNLRRICRLPLLPIPSNEDLAKFAAAYGLPKATGDFLRMQTDCIKTEALGMWLAILRMAAKLAMNRGEKLTWELVKETIDALRDLETA